MNLTGEIQNIEYLEWGFKTVTTSVDLEKLSLYISDRKGAAVFGANSSSDHSYWMYEPEDELSVENGEKSVFAKFNKKVGKYRLRKNPEIPGDLFIGGWAGYIGYELAQDIEYYWRQTVNDLNCPKMIFNFYTKVICLEKRTGRLYLFALAAKEGELQKKLEELDSVLSASHDVRVPESPNSDIENIDFDSLRSNFSKDDYVKSIERIRSYIKEGEVYQVNLSQRYHADYQKNAVDAFLWQNKHNPSPYSAYLSYDDFQVVSASPELFIDVQGDVIRTKPIKGTRPRFTGENQEAENRRNIEELRNCEKEMAELNMIIDLERNDLGRICRPGTIKVTQPRTVEEYPTVYHAVATVEGKLRETVCLEQCLRAMFPGGSITGAPKLAAIDVIDELEPTARNIYTGSIGLLGINGRVCLNIAIRTIIISQGKAYAQTGGGIVYDSDPQFEYEETLTKARALIAGIEAVKKMERL